MNNLKTVKFWALGAALLALSPLASCSSESDNDLTTPEEVKINPDGTIPVTLSIPISEFTTRATEAATNDEAKVTDLWLCAFPKSKGDNEYEGQKFIQNLITSDSPVIKHEDKNSYEDTDYTNDFTVNLRPGKYKFYVLANFTGNNYVSPGSITSASEAASIEALVINFEGHFDTSGKGLSSIPMACLHSDIKEAPNGPAKGSDENNEIEIGYNKSNKIYAGMSMLCAKVRYTILFDHTDFSNKFTTVDSHVDYTSITGSNVRKQTYLSIGNENTKTYEDNLGLTFSKYTEPSEESAKSTFNNLFSGFKSLSDTPTTPALADFSSIEAAKVMGSFSNEEKRVWQGTVYLPENRVSESYTKITFTPDTGIGEQKEDGSKDIGYFQQEFLRGNYYDVVAKVVSPSEYYYDVTVYVKVNPWTYHSSAAIEW